MLLLKFNVSKPTTLAPTPLHPQRTKYRGVSAKKNWQQDPICKYFFLKKSQHINIFFIINSSLTPTTLAPKIYLYKKILIFWPFSKKNILQIDPRWRGRARATGNGTMDKPTSRETTTAIDPWPSWHEVDGERANIKWVRAMRAVAGNRLTKSPSHLSCGSCPRKHVTLVVADLTILARLVSIPVCLPSAREHVSRHECVIQWGCRYLTVGDDWVGMTCKAHISMRWETRYVAGYFGW